MSRSVSKPRSGGSADKEGPTFATTRRPTRSGEITTQAGPKFTTTEGQTGASSGDHTHARLCVPLAPGGERVQEWEHVRARLGQPVLVPRGRCRDRAPWSAGPRRRVGQDDRQETAVLLPGLDLARSSALRRGRTPGGEVAILQPVFGLFVLQVCIYLICRAGFPEGRFGFPVPLAEPG
jgi:hypothetical protein